MTDNFGKFTVNKNNAAQMEALKKLGNINFGVNDGKIVKVGNDMSVFQGDVNNLQKSPLGQFYNEEQIQTIFSAVDVDGNGKLDSNEINMLATLGDDPSHVIPEDKATIDESDFGALFDLAENYVNEALTEPVIDTGKTTTTDTNNGTRVKEEPLTEYKPETEVKQEIKTTTSNERATISDNDALARAQELRSAMAGWGTDEKTVTRILEGSGYSTADIVKISSTFENAFGESLMHDVQNDFSGKAETVHREVLYNAASEEARQTIGWNSTDDIPKDVVAKANEFYAELESASALGYMKDFKGLSDEDKAQILVACDMLHPDQSAVTRVTENRVWFGKEDGYVDDMIGSLMTVANTKPAEAPDVSIRTSGKVADEAKVEEMKQAIEQATTTTVDVAKETSKAAKTSKTATAKETEKTNEVKETAETKKTEDVKATEETEETQKTGTLTDEAYKDLAAKVDGWIKDGFADTAKLNELMNLLDEGGYDIKDFITKYDAAHSTSLLNALSTKEMLNSDDFEEVTGKFNDKVINSYGGVNSSALQKMLDKQCLDEEGNWNYETGYVAQQLYTQVGDGILAQETDKKGLNTLSSYYYNHTDKYQGLQGMQTAKGDYDGMIATRDEFFTLCEKYKDNNTMMDCGVEYENYGMGGGIDFWNTHYTGQNSISEIYDKISEEGIGNGTRDVNDYYMGMIKASLAKLKAYDEA